MRKYDVHPRTQQINSQQKHKAKHARHTALDWLAKKFPTAFDNTKQMSPLKVGIMSDILQYAEEAQQAGISKSKLREAVVVYTRRIDYLVCLKAQETRIDLNGNAVEVVTTEEAERAALKIKKRVEKTARNARKMSSVSVASTAKSREPFNEQQTSFGQKPVPSYIERTPAFSSEHGLLKKNKPTTVMVRNKNTKQYDPSAVARLKEKLGLSQAEKID